MSTTKMILSSNNTTSALKAPKSLTDFSIQTIIGNQQDDAPISAYRVPKIEKIDNPSENINQNNATTHQEKCQPNTSTVASSKRYRPKNFQCPTCNMAFSNNGQLTNHVRIHTGERPFECDFPECNKTFTRNEELTRHKLIHTGVRPHACPTCGKRFGRKDHLKKHFRTHERKRLRRKVFIPTSAFGVREDTLFCPSKQPDTLPLNRPQEDIMQNRIRDLAFANSNMSMHLNSPSMLMPQTSVPNQVDLTPKATNELMYSQPQIPMLESIANPMATATNAIQQFANDYWYGLLDFYRNQNLNTTG